MKLLKQLYAINSKSGNEAEIKALVRSALSDVELHVVEDDFGNIFITKGVADVYPCVTAHLDEVHPPQERTIVEQEGSLYAVNASGGRVGLGADDKNGVWIIIKLLYELPMLKVVLFVQEERDGDMAGCRGSRVCSLEFFADVSALLALDRKGGSEIVTVGKGDIRLCDDAFVPQQLREVFGYECVSGGRTDVVALKERGLMVPCCNIGCGYYNAHKAEEYTLIAELHKAHDFVLAWLRMLLSA
jgi:putative aminopeptidase FrvX